MWRYITFFRAVRSPVATITILSPTRPYHTYFRRLDPGSVVEGLQFSFGVDHIEFLVDTVTLELFSPGTAVANYYLIKTPYSVTSGDGVFGSLKAAVTILRLIS